MPDPRLRTILTVGYLGAVFADMFNNRQRGLAVTVFAMTVFAGPLLAPFIGGFINQSFLGWRYEKSAQRTKIAPKKKFPQCEEMHVLIFL